MHSSSGLDNKILLAQRVLEQLAVSIEPDVQAVLTDEIFETFVENVKILELIERELLPATPAVYEKWS